MNNVLIYIRYNIIIIIFTQVLFNRVFSTPEFQDLRIVDIKSLQCIPKSYEIYLTESFKFNCDICENLYGSTFNCFHYPKVKSSDSWNFLGAALSPLADELVRSCSNMESLKFELAPLWEYVTSQWEKDGLARQEQIFLLLQKKQYFPYTYIKDIET